MKRATITLLSICIFATAFSQPATPISASVKANKDYRLTLGVLRKLSTVIANFPDVDKNKNYDKIKSLFRSAGEDYYGRNFTEAVIKFTTLKKELIAFLNIVAKQYLNRTKSILDSTAKESFDIIIDFGKESSFSTYFHKPFDPLKDVKPYTKKYGPKDYHFFKDKTLIETYLKEGYMMYHYSKNIYEDPEIAILNTKKRMTPQNMKYIIERYIFVIQFCRQAKQYGIEIHKIRKLHEISDILRKYNLSGAKLTPIFDDRIPENFKVDAIDNLNLLYSIEKKRLDNYK